MKLTGLAKANAKSDTSSAVLNVHILQVKKDTITNVNKPLGNTVSQIWNKHSIHRIIISLKPNVTLQWFSVHLFQYVCFWAAVYILISCEIRECSVRNLSRLMNEWCAASCEQYPLTSVALLNLCLQSGNPTISVLAWFGTRHKVLQQPKVSTL